MSEEQLQPLVDAVRIYTSFFILLIFVIFIIFIILIILLIKNIKNRKNLKRNKSFLSETISIQEEERRRISQELHDTVSQNIKALLLMERECEEKADEAGETALKTELQKIITLEKQNQKQLRSIIQNLVVPSLKGVPFKTVITDLCDQFTKQSGLPCNFYVAPEVDLEIFSIEERHHILRIIQEALNNARLHAHPEETNVVIRKHENKIRIMIFDDGEGIFSDGKEFISNELPFIEGQTHFGMTGLEMRALLLGGTLTVHSSKETGTEIRVDLQTNPNNE